jgi:hypothetical protein
MPVPKRRRAQGSGGLALSKISSQVLKLLDIDFVWQRTKTYVLYAFPIYVLYTGLNMEPKPSFFDLINLWE